MKSLIMTGSCLVIAATGACSTHKTEDRSIVLDDWGNESQVKDYHNPIVFEITVNNNGYSYDGVNYSLNSVEGKLREFSKLRPKPVIIVRANPGVSDETFYTFQESVSKNFGCTPVICLVGG